MRASGSIRHATAACTPRGPPDPPPSRSTRGSPQPPRPRAISAIRRLCQASGGSAPASSQSSGRPFRTSTIASPNRVTARSSRGPGPIASHGAIGHAASSPAAARAAAACRHRCRRRRRRSAGLSQPAGGPPRATTGCAIHAVSRIEPPHPQTAGGRGHSMVARGRAAAARTIRINASTTTASGPPSSMPSGGESSARSTARYPPIRITAAIGTATRPSGTAHVAFIPKRCSPTGSEAIHATTPAAAASAVRCHQTARHRSSRSGRRPKSRVRMPVAASIRASTTPKESWKPGSSIHAGRASTMAMAATASQAMAGRRPRARIPAAAPAETIAARSTGGRRSTSSRKPPTTASSHAPCSRRHPQPRTRAARHAPSTMPTCMPEIASTWARPLRRKSSATSRSSGSRTPISRARTRAVRSARIRGPPHSGSTRSIAARPRSRTTARSRRIAHPGPPATPSDAIAPAGTRRLPASPRMRAQVRPSKPPGHAGGSGGSYQPVRRTRSPGRPPGSSVVRTRSRPRAGCRRPSASSTASTCSVQRDGPPAATASGPPRTPATRSTIGEAGSRAVRSSGWWSPACSPRAAPSPAAASTNAATGRRRARATAAAASTTASSPRVAIAVGSPTPGPIAAAVPRISPVAAGTSSGPPARRRGAASR